MERLVLMPSSRAASKTLSMSATDWSLLLMLSVLWGGSFYFAKIAVLEREAAALKKLEVPKAVRWIKAAISEYELSAADLGL